MLRRFLWILLALVAVVAAAVFALGQGWLGHLEDGGVIVGPRRDAAVDATRRAEEARAAEAIGAPDSKQILFGDLHVHTTFSGDAFMLSLPIAQGEGAHPPADACDFARFCSQLDFWSINDHAEGLAPRQWRETVETIRACNAVAGDAADPDTVAFLGWEWTQVGRRPQEHYGHKNVVLRGLDDDEITARPIAAGGQAQAAMKPPGLLVRAWIASQGSDRRYDDFAAFLAERARNVPCPEGVPSPEIEGECVETAATPEVLFRKLDEWGVASLVIPHGTTWGFYTPPGSTWDKQLSAAQHDPERQRLLEIFSGHGNSEQYRPWRAVRFDADGRATCPEPTPDYLPSCWRAGQIIRARCDAAGIDDAECQRREELTRQWAAESGVAGHLVVPGESADEWLDAGQCRDCTLPAFNFRPGGSAQYILALRNLAAAAGEPDRFRFGFIGSSDNHFARPGTGYKEFGRKGMTESRDVVPGMSGLVQAPEERPEPEPRRFDVDSTRLQGFQLVELERQASFFMTGGLVAAHASGRDRGAIWDALERREVYATSGPRILLWFDLLNPPQGNSPVPMGGAVVMEGAPRFAVRAVGSFEQQPGCPDESVEALGAERLQRLCLGECYHPSDVRRPITRVEVVRVRPRVSADEDVAGLVDDPWLVFECPDDPSGCSVEFEDAELGSADRDVVYYVRAIEAPSLAVNAGGLRCDRDANGSCVEVHRCGTPETAGDDCLAENEERAWSSPIYVDRPGGRAGAAAP